MRQKGLLLALMTILLTPGLRVYAQAVADSEYLVKAGFIYNFAKLVQWPSSAFDRHDSPIVLGVVGNEEFAGVLRSVVSGKKIDARPFVVKTLDWGKELKDCHIVFVSTESRRGDDVIQMLSGSPALTIAESPGSAKRGFMINFILENSKVQFEVNLDAASQSDLSISSRLLSLAKNVQGRMH
jgi:hypothetical protein